MKNNFFATTPGIVVVGAIIGLLAILLQKFGNPANMGICVACFERDISGALGLHRAAIVQYLRPEIMGLVLGSLIASIVSREFKPRGGSAPLVRFLLGIVAAMGALVFLGCPWRTILRLAGGDGNALFGFAGLAVGIFIGTLFFRKGYSLGRSEKQSTMAGAIFPLLIFGLLLLYVLFPQVQGQPQSGPLFYSVKGPGSMHAPFGASLGFAVIIGFLAQRSRFCTMGALRDLFLFRYWHLFLGILALFVVAFGLNAAFGTLKLGFAGQPVAHTDSLWNFGGMVTAGLAFALAGGCPGRQLFMAGEGDSDAGIFAIGMLVGAALAHNLGTASSGAGIGTYGIHATVIGFIICLAIGFAHIKRA
ncbi:MAG: YedE-related selenium metabolism membrane protein [Desulfovibrionaceae bacterium]|nr:YedE-related selenium metabolism membrane protein [Desulfovibrionaceae bacterium]